MTVLSKGANTPILAAAVRAVLSWTPGPTVPDVVRLVLEFRPMPRELVLEPMSASVAAPTAVSVLLPPSNQMP